MNKETILVIATVLAIVAVILSPGVGAVSPHPPAVVNIAVQPGYVAISVAPPEIDFGVVPLGTTNQTTGDLVNATNVGNIVGHIDARSLNTTDWTLTETNDTGVLVGERFFLAQNETGPGTWEPLTLDFGGTRLVSSLAADASALFDLQIGVSPYTLATAAQMTNVTMRIVAV